MVSGLFHWSHQKCSTDFIASDFKIDDVGNNIFILCIFTLTKVFIAYEMLSMNCPVLRIPNFKGGVYLERPVLVTRKSSSLLILYTKL
jgi:hypothetical protein